jgi:LmbE family N-acetylglucosaminyl deacetylase
MKILVIAPHPDDEILGVGGTILKNTAAGNPVNVVILTRGTAPIFTEESVKRLWDEAAACHEFLGVSEVQSCGFPAAMLETVPRHELNAILTKIIRDARPDEVYIPHWGDMQKDHQLVAEAAMVALRPKYEHRVKRIFAYETLSETGWNVPALNNAFIPNVFVDIGPALYKKMEALRIYESQLSRFPNPRSVEAVEALARFRGSTVCLEAAEAFVLVREVR